MEIKLWLIPPCKLFSQLPMATASGSPQFNNSPSVRRIFFRACWPGALEYPHYWPLRTAKTTQTWFVGFLGFWVSFCGYPRTQKSWVRDWALVFDCKTKIWLVAEFGCLGGLGFKKPQNPKTQKTQIPNIQTWLSGFSWVALVFPGCILKFVP